MSYIPPSPALMPNASPDMLITSGTQTSPTTNTVICQFAGPAPAAGQYYIELTIQLTGTAETALTNLKLTDNAVSVATGIPTLQTGGVPYKIIIPKQTITGAGAFALKGSALGVVGAIYTASMQITRIG